MYVGRNEAVNQLLSTLNEGRRDQSKVVIQSIEGPGGIGKTALFEHVLDQVDRAALKLLTMKVSGDPGGQRDPFELVQALIANCEVPMSVQGPLAHRFTNTEKVRAVYRQLTERAKSELQRVLPEQPIDQLMRLLRASVECGQRINSLVPRVRDYVNFDGLEENLPRIEEVLKSLQPLMDEVPGFLEDLGVIGNAALRNAVRANALKALTEAFVDDLTALLVGYERRHLLQPAQARVAGIERLLLVLDDYESLASHLGEFLVSHLIHKLKQCSFESMVIIIGRDQLALTSALWNQHHQRALAPSIPLSPLNRQEMDDLVRRHGRDDANELDRAWGDTMGYPLLVTLWLEEANEAGPGEGPNIGMLKRFHDRTTHWMTDEQKRWLCRALFLSEVNVETFGAILENEEEGRRAMQWFASDGSVRDAQGRAFRVRPYVRNRLAEFLKRTDPRLFRHLQSRGDNLAQVPPADDGQGRQSARGVRAEGAVPRAPTRERDRERRRTPGGGARRDPATSDD